MITILPARKRMLNGLLQKGHSLWVLYLDIMKFHEVEFREGYETCNLILKVIEEEISQTLQSNKHFFHAAIYEHQGGDDFIVYLAPNKYTPWTISELTTEFVAPLQFRINKKIETFVNEIITLRSGLVECKHQPGRSIDYLIYEAIKEALLLSKSEPDPYYFSRRDEVDQIIRNPKENMRSAFQPILNVKNGEVFGFEALARLKAGSAFPNIGELFPFSEKIGKLYPIETICRRSAIFHAPSVLQPNEYLFLNINPQVLADPDFSTGQTRKILSAQGLSPTDVVLELTERSAIQDFDTFREALGHYRKQGYLIALDDVGAGYSSLQSIAELHPEFLKIDRSLIQDIHTDSTKWALFETFVSFARRIGCRIIAEGVETEEEMQTVVQLGVDFVQGYFIAKPAFERPPIQEATRRVIKSRGPINFDSQNNIYHLINPLPLFPPQTTVETLQQFFRDHPKITLIGVQEKDSLLGVVQTDKFYATLATRYGVSLYSDRSITYLMDKKPLMVEDTTPIEVISSLAMARSDGHLYDGIIVAHQHKPIGMIKITDLIKALADIQIQIARGANPLTGLPGNLTIEQEFKRRLGSEQSFGVIYADLNRFKAFNDIYGFQYGDSVIKLLGDVLYKGTMNIDHQGFVGHVGGDDFIVIINSDLVKEAGEHLLSSFKKRLENFHIAKDVSLSLAGKLFLPGTTWTINDISEHMAELKRKAKLPKNNYFYYEAV